MKHNQHRLSAWPYMKIRFPFITPIISAPPVKSTLCRAKKRPLFTQIKHTFFIFVFKLDTNIQIIYNEYIKFNNVIAE